MEGKNVTLRVRKWTARKKIMVLVRYKGKKRATLRVRKWNGRKESNIVCSKWNRKKAHCV